MLKYVYEAGGLHGALPSHRHPHPFHGWSLTNLYSHVCVRGVGMNGLVRLSRRLVSLSVYLVVFSRCLLSRSLVSLSLHLSAGY